MLKACNIKVGGQQMVDNLVVIYMYDFDVIFGMYWLCTYHANVKCHKKEMIFQLLEM